MKCGIRKKGGAGAACVLYSGGIRKSLRTVVLFNKLGGAHLNRIKPMFNSRHVRMYHKNRNAYGMQL